MKLTSATAVVLGILLFTTRHAFADGCQLKQVASLDVLPASNGGLLVPVSVNGVQKFFEFDIEANFSYVSPSLIDELKLERQTLRFDEVESVGFAASASVNVPDIRIGSGEFKTPRLFVSNSPPSDSRIAGELGLDILTIFDVELDLGHQKINLFMKDHCKGQVVCWADTYDSFPIVRDGANGYQFQMWLDGTPIDVWLSTAAQRMALFRNTAGRLFNIRMDSPLLQPADPLPSAHPVVAYRYPFKNLYVGKLSFRDPPIYILDADGCDYGKHIFNATLASRRCVGAGLALTKKELQQIRLYLAFGEMTAYVTGADAHK
jgi:hypothetical protein